MTPPAKVLIVDDEIDLVRLVQYNLEKEGFVVLTAYDGRGAFHQVRDHHPDLMILDLMLPDVSGIHICKAIKTDSSVKDMPIIMLTARSSEGDRVMGFEAGADDYVVKPFSPKELVLRVKAMLGRTMSQRPAEPEKITLGNITIYPKAYSVEDSVGRSISLSYLEFKLLLSLAKSPGMVKTREQLIADVWEEGGEEILDRTVDTHIKRLRKKLGPSRDMIETIRGVGYRLMDLSREKSVAR